MAHSVAMGTIVTRAQRRANKENDDSIGSSEWKALVNELYGELQAAVAGTGLRYFESTQTITADGSASYSLPSDHLSTINMTVTLSSSGTRRVLRPLMVQERASRAGRVGDAFEYELAGGSIIFYPTPGSGTYYHLYVPQPTDVSAYADGTTVDLVTVDGEKFVIYGAACIAKAKEEGDLSFLMRERDAARERLVEWAALRHFNDPRRPMVVDDDLESLWPLDPGDWRYR